MKKFVAVLGIAGLSLALIGCQKPPKEEASLVQEIAYENEAVSNVTDVNAVAVQSPATMAATTTGVIDNAVSNATATMTASVSENPTTKDVQQALKNAGLYEGKVDGSIGPKSKKAIRDFQAQNDLKVDGKVGPKTWSRLGSYLGQSGQSVSSAPVADAPAATTTTKNSSLGE